MSHWVHIPPTSPERYISYVAALNLILPGETTGDWHFRNFLVSEEGAPPHRLELAGKGSAYDTTPILGTRGIREVTEIFRSSRRGWNGPPVFAANHFRALADLAYTLNHDDSPMGLVANDSLNQWLNNPDEFETLRAEYLAPLASAIHPPAARRLFKKWFETVRYTP